MQRVHQKDSNKQTKRNIWQKVVCFGLGLFLVIYQSHLVFANPELVQANEQAAQQAYTQGQQFYEQERYRESLEALETAQRLFESGQDPLRTAIVNGVSALVHQKLGELDQAEILINLSLQTKALEQFPLLKTQLLDIKAQLLYLQEDYQAALKVWQSNQVIYQQQGNIVNQLTNLINQGYAYLALGDDHAYYKLVAEIKSTELRDILNLDISTSDRQLALEKLSIFLQNAGETPQAVNLLEFTLTQYPENLQAKFELAKLFQAEADKRAYNNESSTPSSPWQCLQIESISRQSLANYQRASQHYQAILQAEPTPRLKFKTQIKLLQILSRTDQNQAQNLLTQISDFGIPPNRRLILSEVELTQTINCFNPDQALNLLLNANAQANQLNDPYIQSVSLGNLGTYHEIQGQDLDQAQKYTDAALAIAQNTHQNGLGYQWLWQNARIARKKGQLEDAIAYYDSASILLRKLNSSWNDKLIFFRDIRPFYLEYIELILSQPDTISNLRKAEVQIISMNLYELQDLVPCHLNLANFLPITEIPHPQETIVYPALLNDRLELVAELPEKQKHSQSKNMEIHKPKSVHTSVSIPDMTAFKSNLNQFKFGVRSPRANNRVLLRLSQELYQYLVKPLEPYLSPGSTLVFVTDGELLGVPFAALHDSEQYLIDKYSLAVSSGYQFETGKSITTHNTNAVVAGISSFRENLYSQQLPALPAVSREIQSIASLTRQEALLNDRVTREKFKNAVEQNYPEIVHLATHGQFSTDPQLTRFFLWDESLPMSEFAHVLEQETETNLQLLVLSACETAVGNYRAALGMAGTAMRANAVSTVASLWQVSDRSTAELMEQFYTGLFEQNLSKAEALRQAQLTLLRKQQDFDGRVQPYNWAAFVLAGDWY